MLGFRLSLHRLTGELFFIFDEAAHRLRRDEVATWGSLRDEVGSGGSCQPRRCVRWDCRSVCRYRDFKTIQKERRRRVVEVCPFEIRSSLSDG